jgi:uncharacterized membrane protein YqjE
MDFNGGGPAARMIRSVRSFVAVAVEILATRATLLSHEAAIEYLRLRDALLVATGAFVCLAFTIGLLLFLLIAAFWDSHRLLTIALAAAGMALAAAALAYATRRMLRRAPSPFAGSLRELAADRDALLGEHRV